MRQATERENMYPKLNALLDIMAGDNCMTRVANPVWPSNAPELEKQATRLNTNEVDCPSDYSEHYDNELEIMAEGEHSDCQKLITQKGLTELDRFLNEAFDGDLHDTFFED